jgi:hypothetical protein
MKTLTKKIAISALTIGLLGCSKQMGVFENHPVKYNKDFLFGNSIILYSTENNGYIYFSDEGSDGRIEEILLSNVKKDDSLEDYATFEVGQKILNQFLENKN